jgi:hypothetical protein
VILLTAELRCAVSPLTPLSLPCWEAVPYTLELYLSSTALSWDGASSTETEIAPDLLCVAL